MTENWESVVQRFKDAEPHKDRTRANASIGYQIQLHNLTGYVSMKTLALHDISYEFRLTFYDTVYKQFIGKTWKSPEFVPHNSQGQTSQLNIHQVLYFHTPYVDPSIIVVVEIVKIATPKNDSSDKSPTLSTLGWGTIRIFKTDLTLNTDVDSEQKTMVVYHGTPRALLFMDDMIEGNALLQPVPGCHLKFNFKKHPALNQIIHLMPENVFFSSTDCLPGMAEQASQQDQDSDNFYNPMPLKRHTCYIDNLSVSLGGRNTIEKFEETMCQKINKDRLLKDKISDDGKIVEVTERRLMIGVHNGYCYIQKPQFFQLEPNAVFDSRTGSFGRGKRKEPSAGNMASTCLVHRSRVHLDEMVKDPGMAIVMQLEYQLAMPHTSQTSVRNSAASLHTQPISVSVRWAVVCPFSRSQEKTNVFNIPLRGPMASNPDSVLFYTFDTSPEDELGKITFKFLTTDSSPSGYQGDSSSSMSAKPPVYPQSPVVSAGKFKQSHKSPKFSSLPSLQDEEFREDLYKVEISHLEMEGDMPPVHAPPLVPVSQRTPSLNRATYARLYSSGFPDITDRDGRVAAVVDPTQNIQIDLQKEIQDLLVVNEITIQFLAFSKPVYGVGENQPINFSNLFCSFQFYRFQPVTTSRMNLSKVSGQQNISHSSFNKDLLTSFILRKIQFGDQIDKGPPGLEVKYFVDPAHMKPGENIAFLEYLLSHSLHVDVWDGDSLLLIGSFSVPLKYILRQGRSAVAVNHEINVVFEEQTNTVPKFAADSSIVGGYKALGVKRTSRGKMHIRLGSCGHQSEGQPVYSQEAGGKRNLVIADMSGCSFLGGSVSTAKSNVTLPAYTAGKKHCHVKRIVEANQEISRVLLMNTSDDKNTTIKSSMMEEIDGKETSESIRKRKLARMLAIRDAEKNTVSGTTLGQRALVNTQERALKLRDLKTIDSYRTKLKPDHIKEMLLLSITTQHTICPSFGVTEFVELQVKNPFTSEHSITVECDSPELRVVTDAREWRYFKALSNLHTPVEDSMFSFDSTSLLPQVFLRPKETIFIPFRYQGFEVDREVHGLGPSQFFQPTETSMQPTKGKKSHGTIKSKVVKAFLRTRDGKPLSVLQLNVEPQPHVVDQTFRFYNPENTFIKKCIRLPPFKKTASDPGEKRLHVECSDNEVVCQSVAKCSSEPQEIFIKASCGTSPSLRRFYLALYNDLFLASPIQVWQIYVHALNRIDVNCVIGQSSKISVVLRGTQTSRMVQCFPSHPDAVQVSPNGSFMLSSNQMSELNVTVRALNAPATKYMYIHVVDVEYHQLIQAWLVVVNTKLPMIDKEFNIKIPSIGGKESNKSITYSNPYSTTKKFQVLTSRPDILQFVDDEFELRSGETFPIGMRFASGVSFSDVQTVYVFINDDEDKNEETFVINVTYY